VFDRAGIHISGGYEVYPSPQQILAGLGDRNPLLILDELEQGIPMIAHDAGPRQNGAFFQMAATLGAREQQVTVLASVYDAGQEPGTTLVGRPHVRVQFARAAAADRAGVVLHRLFSNYRDFDRAGVRGVLDSVLNSWASHLPTLDLEVLR